MGAYKSVAVRRHHDRIAELGCLVCGAEATLHHVTARAHARGRLGRDEWKVVPLCPRHHHVQFGPESVEALGHQGFYLTHGIDLLAEAERLAAETRAQ